MISLTLAVSLIILSASIRSIRSIPIDNGVESEPEIECGAGYMSVTFSTRNNFDGHIYAKGHYNDSNCRTDRTGQRTASIRLSFNECGLQRTRSLNPKGIYVGAVLVITFHPKFITKVDRAYSMQCFYMEAEKPVTVQLYVSELATVLQTQRVPMPQCRYEVLEDGANGPPIRYAIVGQRVYHKWTCETEATDVFCMYVNSCYVSDGADDRVQIMDATGCAVDRYVLQNLEYLNDLTAGQEAHVFKFADRTALYFQCQITITVREPQGVCVRPACTVGGGETQPSPPVVAPPPRQGYQSRSDQTNRFVDVSDESPTSNRSIDRIGTTTGTPGTTRTTASITTSTASTSRPTTEGATPRIILTRAHRWRRASSQSRNGVSVGGEPQSNVCDVQAQVINAFDVDENAAASALKTGAPPSSRLNRHEIHRVDPTANQMYCMQPSSVVFLLAMCIGSGSIVLISSVAYCARRRKSDSSSLIDGSVR